MAASKDPHARLHHILDEATAIAEATRDLTFEAFNASWLDRRAVERGLMIISEASKALPSQLKATQPRIPWARIESLGNILRHEYKDVDPEVLWGIIQHDLASLMAAVRTIIELKK
jgi:uncharacterized protein with HEPN domain